MKILRKLFDGECLIKPMADPRAKSLATMNLVRSTTSLGGLDMAFPEYGWLVG
ncbi:MAG: hypothetical protein JWO15_360 [Sphingomonadales bacterium]|nr:hypothetical protein [Sphingomonadales bacterium]